MKAALAIIGVIAYLLVGCVVAAITEDVTNPKGRKEDVNWDDPDNPKTVIVLWPLMLLLLGLYYAARPFCKLYEILLKWFMTRGERVKNGRQKGKKGELELAHVLRDYGYDTRRGQQYCGANGDADVVGLPGVHIECKRVERLNLEDAVAQAQRDAKLDEMPVVMHRRNRGQWMVTMPLADWMELYKEAHDEL